MESEVVGMLIFAAILGLIPAAIAKHKGRDFALWWVYGFGFFLRLFPDFLYKKTNRRPARLRVRQSD